MSKPAIRVRYTDQPLPGSVPDRGLPARFAAIRAQFEVPVDFPADVLAEATAVVADPVEWPSRDETAVPFLTIDPPGSMDLDQALHIERSGVGFRVRYAIAYLPAYVVPGGALDTEARRRGQTIYAPDARTPLHPPALSEGAASLLPDAVRAAYVWDMELAESGAVTSAKVYRALVRSVNRFDYEEVQSAIDGGTDDERLRLLADVGERRLALEKARGGASLPMPEQQVTQDADGVFALSFRPPQRAEEWNAQISLMTGMAAADLMMTAKVGLLRALPPPDQGAVARFRRQAAALGVAWPPQERYGDLLRRLDRSDPKHLALIYEATSLFRGSSYVAVNGAVPPQSEHSAIAGHYAHVTAPLRRLVDRFGLVIAECICAGQPVPTWVIEALPTLPDIMATTGRVASGVERACTDTVEAAILAHRVGEDFAAVVVDRAERGRLVLQLIDPAVIAMAVDSAAAPGDLVTARLIEATIATGTVRFQLIPPTTAAKVAG